MQTHSQTHAAHGTNAMADHKPGGHYGRFALMLLLSFACMYALMYAMVDRFANVVPNVNQFYMAALMTATNRRDSGQLTAVWRLRTFSMTRWPTSGLGGRQRSVLMQLGFIAHLPASHPGRA